MTKIYISPTVEDENPENGPLPNNPRCREAETNNLSRQYVSSPFASSKGIGSH